MLKKWGFKGSKRYRFYTKGFYENLLSFIFIIDKARESKISTFFLLNFINQPVFDFHVGQNPINELHV